MQRGSKWAAEGGGNGLGPQYLRRVACVMGQTVCWHRHEAAVVYGKQGGTAEIIFSVLAPLRGSKDFFHSGGNVMMHLDFRWPGSAI